MKIATAKLIGMSPYSQGKFFESASINDGKELSHDKELRTWRRRLHSTKESPDGDEGYLEGNVFIPPMSLKNSVAEAAKYLSLQIPGKGKATYTKNFEAGVLVLDPIELGIKVKDVAGEMLFLPADGVRGSGKRVKKMMPVIHKWEGVATFHILDEQIGRDVFGQVLRAAGSLIGIGRFRPRRNGFYGRFDFKDLTWQDS